MKDIKLDDNFDIDISNFDLSITSDLGQKIKQRLKLFKGEWFLNQDAGIPYFEEIFGKRNALSIIESRFVNEISQVPEVGQILKFNLTTDDKFRELTVECTVKGIDDEIVEVVL